MKLMMAFVACAMLVMLMEGCARQADGTTVGQRLDRVLDRTNLALAEAGDSLTVEPSGSVIDAVAETVSDRALLKTLDVADAGISASIKSELARDPALNGVKIGVESRNGVVSLSGRAEDERTRERAEQVARSNKAVVGVNNNLTVGRL